jgi:hypothetical protein
MELTAIEINTEERLPWHKPAMERLTVCIDTALGGTSGGDFGTGSIIGT